MHISVEIGTVSIACRVRSGPVNEADFQFYEDLRTSQRASLADLSIFSNSANLKDQNFLFFEGYSSISKFSSPRS